MRVTIRHGGGEALVRAAGLTAEIRAALDVEVIEEPGAEGSLEVEIDGEPIARRHGGPLQHVVGLGWPDAETIILAIRERLARQTNVA
jgi:hypothetical protein